MGTCYIVGALMPDGLDFVKGSGDVVIAADGGFEHLNRWGIDPDIVIGDFDSLGYVPEHPNVIKLEKEKDETDMHMAVMKGLQLGYNRFTIYGGLGGRLDHSLANIQTLNYIAHQGGRGFLVGSGYTVTVIRNGSLEFSAGRIGKISVFCMGSEAVGVNLRGLKYGLDNAVLTNLMPLGVSNEFTGAASGVTVDKGSLAVVFDGMI